ncbi:MAG TPA: hypothetical protein VHQ65_12425, partial [Thermoanaerobaculia bacterium]|nr:hypothetical protein [Thermoanaerobaculia bacterium]
MSTDTAWKSLAYLALAAALAAGAAACRGTGGLSEAESPPAAPVSPLPTTTAGAEPRLAPASWFPHDQTPAPDDGAD